MLKVTDSQGNIRDITKVIKTEEVLPEYKADRHGTEEILSSGKSVSPILSINYEGTRQEAEFTYRQTGGGTLIEDIEKAKIEKIKGNTVAWNQFLKENKLVDMGLPSGTLWASCNIDVTQEDGFAESPFQYGCSFFSWGNIDGHNPISNSLFDYDWGTINSQEPWYDGQVYGNTQGNTLTNNIQVGDTYDAARANVGSLFRMPTNTEFAELFANIRYINADGTEVDTTKTDKRVNVNGVMGLYLESRINGARLFLSCSGSGYGRSWDSRGSRGYYWSSTWSSARNARSLDFFSGGVYPQNYNYRYYGFALRPVLTKKLTIDIGGKGHKFLLSSNNKNIIDTTLVYGNGNEPTSVAQFEADYQRWFGKPLTYEKYDAGSLRPVNMTGIKSVGFNQWDEEWELGDINLQDGTPITTDSAIRSKNFIKVLSNTSYYIGCTSIDNSYIKVRYYDSQYVYIGPFDKNNNANGGMRTTPDNCSFIKFSMQSAYGTTYNHDICINISDPAKDGTYEPYIEEVKEFDVTTIKGKLNGAGSSVTIFPDGMKKAGSVYDEIKIDNGVVKAIKRVGSRAYASGDESDTSVITDGNTTTFYELATPQEYVLDIPMKEISIINHTDSNGNIRQVLVGN